eukprot:Stramenopile-MAST_4_protein_4914
MAIHQTTEEFPMEGVVDIEELHARACQAKEETYIDPNSGLTVFTEFSHLKRGRCCGCGCRHCPYRVKRRTGVSSKPDCASPTSWRKDGWDVEKKVSTTKNIIFTKTGDTGTSSLFNGDRIGKTDDVFEALGTVDELSSFIGVALTECDIGQNGLSGRLEIVLSRLLDVGSHIATPKTSTSTTEEAQRKTRFSVSNVEEVEGWIHEYTEKLPDLTNFVLPTGGRAAVSLHVCRTVCRRTERRIAKVLAVGGMDKEVYQYINRLSDFFFVAARWACFHAEGKELVYGNATGLDGIREVHEQVSANDTLKKQWGLCWPIAFLCFAILLMCGVLLKFPPSSFTIMKGGL